MCYRVITTEQLYTHKKMTAPIKMPPIQQVIMIKKINIKYLAMLTLLVAPWRKQNGMTQIYLKEKELQCQDNYQRIMAGFWGQSQELFI